MPEKETLRRVREDAEEGKSASTQAGEFVREEIHHVREGKHGARSAKQTIAIGLSKARRAGVSWVSLSLQEPVRKSLRAATFPKAVPSEEFSRRCAGLKLVTSIRKVSPSDEPGGIQPRSSPPGRARLVHPEGSRTSGPSPWGWSHKRRAPGRHDRCRSRRALMLPWRCPEHPTTRLHRRDSSDHASRTRG